MVDAPSRDEWDVSSDSEAKTALFVEVVDAMRAAARRGIRTVIVGEDPHESDVEDVVVQAFHEVWGKELDQIVSVKGLACRIAKQRGIDRGRRISREQKRRTAMLEDLNRLDRADDLTDFEYAQIEETIQRCKDEDLNDAQRAVIAQTMEGSGEGRVSLKDYAKSRGKQYEACRTMRSRGLSKLRACVKRLLGLGGE